MHIPFQSPRILCCDGYINTKLPEVISNLSWVQSVLLMLTSSRTEGVKRELALILQSKKENRFSRGAEDLKGSVMCWKPA